MFLQVLLRERHVSVADLPAEVESFCVEFMSVKEAADLFRLVKQLQREDARAANARSTRSRGAGEGVSRGVVRDVSLRQKNCDGPPGNPSRGDARCAERRAAMHERRRPVAPGNHAPLNASKDREDGPRDAR